MYRNFRINFHLIAKSTDQMRSRCDYDEDGLWDY